MTLTNQPCVVVQYGVIRFHQLLVHNIAITTYDGDPCEFIAFGGVAHLAVWEIETTVLTFTIPTPTYIL